MAKGTAAASDRDQHPAADVEHVELERLTAQRRMIVDWRLAAATDDEDSDSFVGDDPAVLVRLEEEGARYRRDVAVVVAAYATVENQLDAVIWSAHRAGASYRAIAEALGLRTALIRTRFEALESRFDM